jgi:hypothetical protein
MRKVPNENGIYRVNNGPEFEPNIAYTKNVNFDEKGVIKLSPALYNVLNDTDVAAFSHTVDAVNTGTGDFTFFTDNDVCYEFDIDDLSSTADATVGMGTKLRVTPYGSKSWLIGTEDNIYEYTYLNVWKQRNDDNVGFLTQFPSRGTWVGENTDDVDQYALSELDDSPLSTTSTGPNLSMPRGYNITGIAYSNYRVGIATENESGGDALFLTWDGASTSANTGVFVKAPVILDVVAYMGSWVILTSKGQLLLFNGSGFDELAHLPSYYANALWIEPFSSRQYGSLMQIIGDRIFINLGSQLTNDKWDSGILRGFYSGVWCYDPAVGLYHRYSLAHSKLANESCTYADGVFTASSAHYLLTGDTVMEGDAKYYAIKIDGTTFKLATSYANAIAGTNTTFSGTPRVLQWVKRTDWGQINFYNNVVGLYKDFNDAGAITDGKLPIFAQALIQKKDLTVDATLCLCHTLMGNIGSVVYNKVKSTEIEDIYNSVIVKHNTLVGGDKIIIKYKIEDLDGQDSIGEANDATPDTGLITWTNATTFTFTTSMMDGSNLEEGDEVEFQSGAGAGQTAHIVSATLVSTTWTVVVDEDIRGGENGNKSTVRFDRFKKLATITSSNSNGVFTAPLNKVSKWCQIKLELRGVDVTIEEMIINNKPYKKVID